jgi:hypothetical protein
MKVIAVDNYARESFHYPDRLERDGLTLMEAVDLADRLNNTSTDDNWYFRAVGDDYALKNYDPT